MPQPTLPAPASIRPTMAGVPLPALSRRSVRNLRQLNTLRSLQRFIALTSAVFVVMLGAGYGIPAYANAVTPEPTPPAVQTLTVPADAVAATAVRDGYTVTDPPPLQWPVPSGTKIADGFGPRIAPCDGCSTFHEGVDFDAGYGAQVHALAAGVVVETTSPGHSALGVHVVIQHLIDGQAVTSVYGHMQTGSMRLTVGDIVAVGQVVGLVGSTGASTGVHLHFEIHPAGHTAVNPLRWMHARLG
ncbi:MAG: M23 family metallopeptidase [Lacisediminihabitans sp.]